MANRENVNDIPRKGKPAGGGNEDESLDEAMTDYTDENPDATQVNSEVKHQNRHLHKGEDVSKFKDRDE